MKTKNKQCFKYLLAITTVIMLLLAPVAVSAADDSAGSGASGTSDSGVSTDSSADTTESGSTSGDSTASDSGNCSTEETSADSAKSDSAVSNSESAEDSSGDGESPAVDTTETDEGNTDATSGTSPDSGSEVEAGETENTGSGTEEPDTEIAPEGTKGDTVETGEPDAGGNSYIATVTPEDGKKVEAGVATNFNVTFTEMGDTDKLGSAQLFIPDSLTVNSAAEVDVTEGWGYSWSDYTDENSSFSKALNLWALLENDYLGKGDSVSAIFSAEATADQTHHFDTKAWTSASDPDSQGNFTAVGEDADGDNTWFKGSNDSDVYSQPKVNVWVDQTDSGFARGNSSNGDLTRGDDLGDVDAARDHDGDLFVGLDNTRENLN